MSRLFYHVMQDNLGNLLFDVTGTMRLAGSGTLATIYGDEALTVVLPNPMTNHPSFGSFKCFLGAGDYDFYMAKGGYTFETLTGVQGHGSMAQQDANAVAITGGSATVGALAVTGNASVTGTATMGAAQVNGGIVADNPTFLLDQVLHSIGMGTAPQAGVKLSVLGGLWAQDFVGIASPSQSGQRLAIHYQKGGINGIVLRPTDNDTGPFRTVVFQNTAATEVGSIMTTASATSFNTTSDARLKHAVTALTNGLDTITALRPVAFRWNTDDAQGHGFLAHELQATIPEAVTGEPGAVNDDGTIRPQGVDHSKLVPHLTAALQELAAQVQALTARLTVLEGAGT